MQQWLLSACLLLGFASTIAAAAPIARNYGTPGDELTKGFAAAADDSGNTYIAGTFGGDTIAFGAVTLTRIGSGDAFVAKIDGTGTVVWAKNFGGPNVAAECRSLVLDSGYVYCGGSFHGANLTTPPLAKLGTNDALVVKLDAGTGAIAWAKNYGGPSGGWMFGKALATDGAGSLFLGGDFSNSSNPTTPPMTRISLQDAFVMKLSAANGNPGWARVFGGQGASSYATGVSARSGSVYVGGYFTTANLTTPAFVRLGSRDAFAIKLDAATGATTWAKNYGGGNSTATTGRALTTNDIGNVYLAGDFNGNMTTPALAGSGGTGDAFVLRVDPGTGTPLWAKSFGGSGGIANASATAIAADASGSLYLGGLFGRGSMTTPPLTQIGPWDALAIKLDAATGNTTWSANFGGRGADAFARAIAADGAGNFHLVGEFAEANLTTPPLTKIGTSDVFLIKYPTLEPIPGTLTVVRSGSGFGTVGGTAGISCGADCTEAFAASAPVVLTATPAAGSLFTGWLGDCAGNGNCNLTINGNGSVTAVFAPGNTWLKYDVDRNNQSDALTDGLIILRRLFGLTGNALISNAIGPNATVTDPVAIQQFIADIAPLIDVDGNGKTDALTDGLMILRYLFGLRGTALTSSAIGAGATRNGTQIETFIQPGVAQ